MRVLVTGFTENYGGVEAFVMNYYRELKKIDPDFTIDVLCYTDNPAYKDDLQTMGGVVYSVPSRRRRGSRKAVRGFFQQHQNEYDVLWCNKCSLIDILVLKYSSNIRKRILHAHSSRFVYEGIRKYLFGFLHHLNKVVVGRYVTDYWACSDTAANWLFPSSILKRGQIDYIPNAIDITAFTYNAKIRDEYREQLNLHGTVYGYIGRLNYNKNPIFAIETFDQLWQKDPNSFLLIVGDGELEQQVSKEISKLLCRQNVRVLGLRNDVPALLQSMDCCLVPSYYEGFPVITVEAQAAGLPVFAASNGITSQAKLTDLFHFLPLSLSPKGWAEEIRKVDLARKDRQNQLRNMGYDVSLAAQNLLTKMRP